MSAGIDIAPILIEMGAAAKARDYLARGRRYESLDAVGLHELHKATFREFAKAPHEGPAKDAHEDCAAEYGLRGLEQDFSELMPEFGLVIQAMEKHYASLTPEQLAEIEADVMRDLVALVRKRN